MTVLDRAICTAVQAHSGAVRKGGQIPYILHPMEVTAICAGMTEDQEVLAAAMLHDVVEDTGYSLEDLEREFGPRVAALVAAETEDKRPGQDRAATWRLRKEETVCRLRSEERLEVKVLALADKLSNLRSMARGVLRDGNAFWEHFHQKDPLAHCWYYREVGAALSELRCWPAWQEYWSHYESIWPGQPTGR